MNSSFRDTAYRGHKSEDQVADFLITKGHTILARNFRCPEGELDIISLSGDVLVITEVKSLTRNWDSDEVRHMVTPFKLAKMKRALRAFLASGCNATFKSIRFDVATVTNGQITCYQCES